jgi:hypothetical protein
MTLGSRGRSSGVAGKDDPSRSVSLPLLFQIVRWYCAVSREVVSDDVMPSTWWDLKH